MQTDNLILIAIEVVALVGLSALCSGLNVALMSLNLRELKRKAKLGNKAARKMLPLRQNVHLTLASILFTNVTAVTATSVVLEARFNGWLAILMSTILLVIFGEIMPQALFGKNPLKWTYRFYRVLQLMRVVTYIVSRPLQILLDKLFPYQDSELHSRHELGLMIGEHLGTKESELDNDEVEIIRGALQLSEKRVRDIMTDMRHTYWLTPTTVLDDARIDEIKAKGFSRIPIFNPQRTKCYGLLLIKDLIDMDFDHNHYRVDDIDLHPTPLIGSMTALDTMFRKFINGGTHLMPIEKDDEIVGIVTIEDLLEEIVGHEIEDETDRQLRAAK